MPNSVLIVCMLVFGSWNTLNLKWQDSVCAPSGSSDGKCGAGQRKFNKPWLQNMLMFMGEASLIAVYGATQRGRRQRAQAEAPRLLPDGSSPKKTPFYIYSIPAFCDVFGTGLGAVAMQYTPSALWQMLRSAIIIFSAILSYFFLGRQFEPFHWVAVGIVFVGLVIVGLANVLDGSSDKGGDEVPMGDRIFGMALVVFAQLCAASQMVVEEKLLTTGAKTSAKKVVGCEGLWGMMYMIVILTAMSMVPGNDNGKFESFPDSMKMVSGSPLLVFFIVTYASSISVYNLTGITVGKKMSTVVRCLVDSCRTVTVWVVNLILYYSGFEAYGAAWTEYSWLTVIGFLILILGTLLYNEVLSAPSCLRKDLSCLDEDSRHDTSSFVLSKDPLIAGHAHTEEEAREVQERHAASGASLQGLDA